jgi:hypothetical protein
VRRDGHHAKKKNGHQYKSLARRRKIANLSGHET